MKSNKVDCIFFDLDGTLLDNSERLYACYKDILGFDGLPVLEKAEYMAMKRRKAAMEDILSHSRYPKGAAHYHALWMDRIEQDSYLDMDRLKGDVIGALHVALLHAARVVMMTKRHNRTGLLRQLDRLGLGGFFTEVINVPDSKIDAIAPYRHSSALYIGDTEDDMNAARSIGARFLAITSGLRERQFLQADGYFDSIASIDWGVEAEAYHGSFS